MSIKASDLIRLCQQAYDERWGYIWGTRGQVWTQAQQDKATREMTVKHGQKWVGRRVADCSGLIKWAVKELGGDIYHGSNTMWNTYTVNDARGAVGGEMVLRPGVGVFQVNNGTRGHVGIYIGGGKCIEAHGTKAGVTISDLSVWDEWGEMYVKVKGKLEKVEYDLPAENVTISLQTIRKGDSGELVKTAQELLIAAGYDVGPKGADGHFGSATVSAVRAFQFDHGIKSDGIVGPVTWAALRDAEGDDAEDEDAPPLTLEERVKRLELAVFGQEGGESDGLDPSGG
jgi:hypothetical protein